jgi:hypothetical protein
LAVGFGCQDPPRWRPTDDAVWSGAEPIVGGVKKQTQIVSFFDNSVPMYKD